MESEPVKPEEQPAATGEEVPKADGGAATGEEGLDESMALAKKLQEQEDAEMANEGQEQEDADMAKKEE